MPNAVVMTGYGPPEVLKWAAVPLPPDAVLGFEAAGTIDAVGPGVTGTAVGDGVTALLFSLRGYAEYAVADETYPPLTWEG